jgi:arsenate reductase
MAAALFNALAHPSKARALSAGTQPAARVHPEVVAVLHEVGIDASTNQPRLLTSELAAAADLLITMGCGEECPVAPGVPRQDWPLRDPRGLPLDEVRRIRDEIRARVEALVVAQGFGRSDR